jgi:hypothetical protein
MVGVEGGMTMWAWGVVQQLFSLAWVASVICRRGVLRYEACALTFYTHLISGSCWMKSSLCLKQTLTLLDCIIDLVTDVIAINLHHSSLRLKLDKHLH